ncbi:hypothetical protein NDU88_002023 [Pleurodeles waltl]|uniref:Uncharacterized protein n=1 Tax=Pleurodeles waltl TaxID=8319 RepID=A0AAV7SD58_PLEWA|nr:hypothetical protein NDU88_002023 [Pleurodeles waltl]
MGRTREWLRKGSTAPPCGVPVLRGGPNLRPRLRSPPPLCRQYWDLRNKTDHTPRLQLWLQFRLRPPHRECAELQLSFSTHGTAGGDGTPGTRRQDRRPPLLQ